MLKSKDKEMQRLGVELAFSKPRVWRCNNLNQGRISYQDYALLYYRGGRGIACVSGDYSFVSKFDKRKKNRIEIYIKI